MGQAPYRFSEPVTVQPRSTALQNQLTDRLRSGRSQFGTVRLDFLIRIVTRAVEIRDCVRI